VDIDSKRFFWSDGTKVDAAFWDKGQPDNTEAKQLSVLFFRDTGKLHDFPRDQDVSGAICQLASRDLPCPEISEPLSLEITYLD